MEGTEVRKLAAVEDRHWWYAERRAILAKALAGLTPGKAVDIGAAGGGNTRVLVEHGWSAAPLEYGADGAEVANERGLPVLRADAMKIPINDGSLDLVVAYDVLEHLEDDDRAVEEIHRCLRPGGAFLISVPADPRLWSAHDEAVGHVRRYTRPELIGLLERHGFEIDSVVSWMVLLRPAVAWRRRSTSGSDLDDPPRLVNAALRSVVAMERVLPLGKLPGVSLVVRARRPA
ncbi:class I SAM-dependent methyltransferase [Luteipulveratus mongoliensis]|uniref:Methyltransferase n=1 Tax=Luteipulveratus mongoliensis TaxID=571913 RepID=A0A0K1JIH0_9MICO|nr:class I SAM-dependent methyltransferase [Luteipulveratus mongoliensis]AKU16501.1 methyltransferase [Luteipulveratus mongoliensis]